MMTLSLFHTYIFFTYTTGTCITTPSEYQISKVFKSLSLYKPDCLKLTLQFIHPAISSRFKLISRHTGD